MSIKWEKRRIWIRHIEKKNRNNGKEYCFLDFDGVINIVCEEGSEKYNKLVEKLKDGIWSDEDSVRRLSDFCMRNQIEIIISSSWRYSGLEECKTYLHKSGLDEKIPIVGTTALEFNPTREDLIYAYLKEHPDFSKIIIFDDMVMNELNEFLVRTDLYTGIDETAIQKGQNILDKQK